MTYRVAFAPEAGEQLASLNAYIASAANRTVADRFTDAIIDYCEGLAVFPERGRARDDIRPGLRVIGYRKRAVIAFAVMGQTVMVLGVYYGGRDYESALSTDVPGSGAPVLPDGPEVTFYSPRITRADPDQPPPTGERLPSSSPRFVEWLMGLEPR
ncbi:MAG: type II toxin-antitoxin system RelE/ParE family toxin [Bifidobacteriaceae bacterium]|nr:type II toxin-antitoxin system RelE/ParE family toxin [Bifidobacteriaceae bacterium]